MTHKQIYDLFRKAEKKADFVKKMVHWNEFIQFWLSDDLLWIIPRSVVLTILTVWLATLVTC